MNNYSRDIEKLLNDARQKSSNNSTGGLVYMHPSDYGFPRTNDGLNKCLEQSNRCKSVRAKFEGKNLISVEITQ